MHQPICVPPSMIDGYVDVDIYVHVDVVLCGHTLPMEGQIRGAEPRDECNMAFHYPILSHA